MSISRCYFNISDINEELRLEWHPHRLMEVRLITGKPVKTRVFLDVAWNYPKVHQVQRIKWYFENPHIRRLIEVKK